MPPGSGKYTSELIRTLFSPLFDCLNVHSCYISLFKYTGLSIVIISASAILDFCAVPHISKISSAGGRCQYALNIFAAFRTYLKTCNKGVRNNEAFCLSFCCLLLYHLQNVSRTTAPSRSTTWRATTSLWNSSPGLQSRLKHKKAPRHRRICR